MKNILRLTLMVKMIVGFLLGFLIGAFFDLPYAYTAGVIAVLSLETTRKKSYTIGLVRLLATLIGLGVSLLLFSFLGFHSWVLLLMIVILIPLAFLTKTESGIVVALVLISQLYLEQDILFVFNALYIFIIGLGVATVLNLWMPPLKKIVAEEIRAIDRTLDQAINDIANQKDVDFSLIEQSIREGRHHLNDDIENKLDWNMDARSDYLNMRERQSAILKRIESTLKAVPDLPQKKTILGYLKLYRGKIGEQNFAIDLKQELDKLFVYFHDSSLPQSRIEFEGRAQLYYILKELDVFLNLKLLYHEKYRLSSITPLIYSDPAKNVTDKSYGKEK